jgi:hypothetical protein
MFDPSRKVLVGISLFEEFLFGYVPLFFPFPAEYISRLIWVIGHLSNGDFRDHFKYNRSQFYFNLSTLTIMGYGYAVAWSYFPFFIAAIFSHVSLNLLYHYRVHRLHPHTAWQKRYNPL